MLYIHSNKVNGIGQDIPSERRISLHISPKMNSLRRHISYSRHRR
jgi:hypothetical protein